MRHRETHPVAAPEETAGRFIGCLTPDERALWWWGVEPAGSFRERLGPTALTTSSGA